MKFQHQFREHPAMIILLFPLWVLAGCAQISARENFEDFQNAIIGWRLQDWSKESDRYLVGSRRLPNGNLAKKYDYSGIHGRCVYYREIDAKTDRVIAWRREGDDSGCRINP